jgi:cytoskeletal protein CcmA (bactofilin family)
MTIGRSLAITGEVTGDEDLVIEGRVDGYITVRDAMLTLGEHAAVRADIRGARVLVRGRVDGSIVASQRIELAPGCHVTGSLSANQVVIADGARFNGRVDMDQRTIAARLAHYKAEHAASA